MILPLRTGLEACKLCPIDPVFHVLMTRYDYSEALHNLAHLRRPRKDFASMTMILQASAAPAPATKLWHDTTRVVLIE